MLIDRRGYLEQIEPFIDQGIVKVIKGMRRTGKSTLLNQLRDKLVARGVSPHRTVVHNFDSLREPRLLNADEAYTYFSGQIQPGDGRTYFFLDEVQELDGWEKVVNSLMLDFDADIYVTGSNSNLLSNEYATYLGGRYVSFEVLPLSFAEVQLFTENTSFERYLLDGGMPFLQSIPAGVEAREKYLIDIYDSIILKDITLRFGVRNVELLKRILGFLIANIGNTLSATNVANVLKSEGRSASPETIYNFIEYAQTANLIYLVPREDVIGKNSLRAQEKIYMTDHGLREALYGSNVRDRNQILENIVYVELRRRGFEVNVGKVKDFEIDFVASKGGRKQYFQVCWVIADKEVENREFRPFYEIPDNFEKTVISTDRFDMSRDGIIHKNIEDWLLDGQ
jgi:predicted AAA+ superfamily ATPase